VSFADSLRKYSKKAKPGQSIEDLNTEESYFPAKNGIFKGIKKNTTGNQIVSEYIDMIE